MFGTCGDGGRLMNGCHCLEMLVVQVLHRSQCMSNSGRSKLTTLKVISRAIRLHHPTTQRDEECAAQFAASMEGRRVDSE